MSDTLAVIAGKISAKAIRAMGAGLGSNLPGRVSRMVSGQVLTNLSTQVRKGVIAVSGTNGKSTTSGLISSILTQAHFKLAHNKQGANLVPGITASMVEAAGWNGKLDADYCLFETDEAALPLVAKEVKINTIVVTNLFRDQLDRFGELDTTASLISKGIGVNKSNVVLNADDPNVTQLAPDCSRLYYGIESIDDTTLKTDSSAGKQSETPEAGVQELAYCANCGAEYTYAKLFYGQLGHYACSQCQHGRPTPDVYAQDVRLSAGESHFTLCYKDYRLPIVIRLPGLFNVYNALAAAALAFSLHIDHKVIAQGLKEYTTLFGRSERLVIRDKTVLIQLIKNPAGASQAVQAAANDPSARLLIAINDNYADGRDVSWLWDAEFEKLANHQKQIFVGGVRAYDMAVRLKYCGIPSDRIMVIPPLQPCLSKALESTSEGEILWILPTYTCLLELQKTVKALGSRLSGT